MSGNGGAVPPVSPRPAPPETRFPALREYHRIMTGAAEFQKMINAHVVASAVSSDPVQKARALDRAVLAAESMTEQFRRARAALSLAAPNFPLPPPPPPAAFRPTVAIPERTAPRRL